MADGQQSDCPLSLNAGKRQLSAVSKNKAPPKHGVSGGARSKSLLSRGIELTGHPTHLLFSDYFLSNFQPHFGQCTVAFRAQGFGSVARYNHGSVSVFLNQSVSSGLNLSGRKTMFQHGPENLLININ